MVATFQGELEITTEGGSGKAKEGNAAGQVTDVVDRVPFLFLGLDLPAAPLYKDVMETNIIPQVLSTAGHCLGHVECAGHPAWEVQGILCIYLVVREVSLSYQHIKMLNWSTRCQSAYTSSSKDCHLLSRVTANSSLTPKSLGEDSGGRKLNIAQQHSYLYKWCGTSLFTHGSL